MESDPTQAPPIAPDEEFWRLVWDPRDIRDGQLQSSAIPSEDLRGHSGRGVSVDRRILAQEECIVSLAARQSGKKPSDLVAPLLCLLRHPDVVMIVDDTGAHELVVVPDPLVADPTPPPLPANPAHAQAHAVGPRSKSQAQRLRAKLLACLGAPMAVDACLPRV